MSPDLTLLVWSTALALVQMLVAVIGSIAQVGLPAFLENREAMPTIQGWAGRANRAHRNMLENLVLFTILVLVAEITGRANAMTAFGSELFFAARLVYVPIYLIGITWVRTGAWAVSVVGLVMIFIQLV